MTAVFRKPGHSWAWVWHDVRCPNEGCEGVLVVGDAKVEFVVDERYVWHRDEETMFSLVPCPMRTGIHAVCARCRTETMLASEKIGDPTLYGWNGVRGRGQRGYDHEIEAALLLTGD